MSSSYTFAERTAVLFAQMCRAIDRIADPLVVVYAFKHARDKSISTSWGRASWSTCLECRDNATGETVLHKAAAKGFYLLCKWLVHWGADPNAFDDAKQMPADVAQSRGYHALATRLKWTTSILLLSAGRKRAVQQSCLEDNGVIVID